MFCYTSTLSHLSNCQRSPAHRAVTYIRAACGCALLWPTLILRRLANVEPLLRCLLLRIQQLSILLLHLPLLVQLGLPARLHAALEFPEHCSSQPAAATAAAAPAAELGCSVCPSPVLGCIHARGPAV
jgi:hypothetical protein